MKEKKHTSIDNQLEKLKGRNITIDQHEEKEIKKILERNNYYNVINAYKDPFLEEKYKDGTTIKEIYNLYSTFAAQNRQVHLNIIGQTRKPLL